VFVLDPPVEVVVSVDGPGAQGSLDSKTTF
jgi:hypothetical protein